MRRDVLLSSLLALTVLSSAHAEDREKSQPVGATNKSARSRGQERTSTLGRIELQITGLRSSRGRVYVALWRNEKKFPGTPPPGTPSRTAKIVNQVAEAQFESVPPGEFAITVFHDEDGDGELKTNFIGIPKEGIGFSRDARARIGAPDYDDAKLVLRPGQLQKLEITMWYL